MDPLVAFGHTRPVPGFGDGGPAKPVDDRAFPDVRNADDHDADGFPDSLLFCFFDDVTHRPVDCAEQFLGFQGKGVNGKGGFPLGLEKPDPVPGLLRIGQVCLVQQQDPPFAGGQPEQLRIPAGKRKTGIADLDDEIHPLQLILQKAPGLGHMPGIPVDLLLGIIHTERYTALLQKNSFIILSHEQYCVKRT